MSTATSFEGLGTFYLGRRYDLAARARGDDLVLLDSKDLTTHALIVGMTGSGKTGLGIGLLEEAALDGIPSIVVDPKGDLANLLLAFPALAPGDFAPWVSPDAARQQGLEPEALAAAEAGKWKSGLAEWGQDGERVRRFRDGAERAVYTPGSSAGRSLAVLRSFAAPAQALAGDAEGLRERVQSTVSGLLGLIGIEADPIGSREHILLSSLLGAAWARGESLDLAGLIAAVQSPPMARIGVLELESFYPPKERFQLAMALNNLLAAPGFAAWLEGEALDVDRLLWTPAGKPRLSVISIAHLPDPERMFFVTLLLTELLAWARRQRGTSSLRALFYMDEIAGYFPPVANPPSKAPLITLMKQARAFGLGIVLATQNPVDLDYKGLANAGTWFIGRLQAERDKLRLLDGLEGAASASGGAFDRGALDQTLSALASRVFLLHSVHAREPIVMETRWTLSYLRGPLTRAEIAVLSGRQPAPSAAAPAAPIPSASGALGAAAAASAVVTAGAPLAGPPAPAGATRTRPVLAPEIAQCFLPGAGGAATTYRPAILGLARVAFRDRALGLDCEEPVALCGACAAGPVALDWERAEELQVDEQALATAPPADAAFEPLPAACAKAKSYEGWKRELAEHLARTRALELLYSRSLGEASRPGESERDFRLRLGQRAREARDAAVEKLRAKCAPKLATLQDRVRRAEEKVAVQEDQASRAKLDTAVSFGSTILSAILGTKKLSSANVTRAAQSARSVSRAGREVGDVERARANVAALKEQLAAVEADVAAQAAALAGRLDPAGEALEKRVVRPKRGDVSVRAVVLAWRPVAGAG